MEVNLGLVERPLSNAANQKHDLGFDSFDVGDVAVRGIFVTPHIHQRLGVMVSPRVAVVAMCSVGRPAQSEACAERLLGNADIDWESIYADDVELRFLRGCDA